MPEEGMGALDNEIAKFATGLLAAWNGWSLGFTDDAVRISLSSAAVVLHWVLAALIIAELTLGFLGLAMLSEASPQNIAFLGGMLILVLMVIRFAVRVCTSRPADAATGGPRFDRIAAVTHYGFYVVVLRMAGTGFATAIITGLGEIVFGPPSAPLPRRLIIYPTFVAHAIVGKLFIGFVILRVLAAFYHQLIRKDRLFQRMSLSRRASDMEGQICHSSDGTERARPSAPSLRWGRRGTESARDTKK